MNPEDGFDGVAICCTTRELLTWGEERVGDVPNTKLPEPVSSEITPANSEDEVAANADNLFDVVATVPVLGNVAVELTPVPPLAVATMPVTLAAVPVVFWFKVGTSPA